MVKTINISDLPIWENADRNKALLALDLELTARCNNNCTHCYINLPEKDKNAKDLELSFDKICALIDEAQVLGVLWVTLSGGEPLLRKDFIKIYRYLKEKGMLVSVFTNAALITDEHVRLFLKYRPRDIEVTVYGVTPEIHKKVTRSNSFEATMAGIDLLVKNGLPLTLKTMVTHSNAPSLPQITKFCRSRTTRPFRFDPVLHLRLDEDYARNQKIAAERLTPDQILDIEKKDPERMKALAQKLTETENIPCRAPDRLFRCNAGTNACCIDYKGQLKLCSALSGANFSIPLNESNEIGLEKAWKAISSRVPDLRSDDPAFIESCGKCRLHNLCSWCPAHAKLETGKLDGAVPYFCSIAKKREQLINSLST